jgi:hypothetical protein
MRHTSWCASLLGIALLLILWASGAQAQTRTWVSGVGNDANPCSRTAPCKTFAGAISKTATGGEINVLDPGGFGALTITKSITISSEGFEGGVLVSGTNGITVNAPGSFVILRGLDFEGLGTGINGVNVLNVGELHIVNCVIHAFNSTSGGFGINFVPSGGSTSNLYVTNSYIADNGSGTVGGGIMVEPGSGTAAKVEISKTTTVNNVLGIRGDASNSASGLWISIKDSVTSGNAYSGITSFTPSGSNPVNIMVDRTQITNNGNGVKANGAAAVLRIGSSTVAGNGVGVSISNGATMKSFGNNQIDNNISAGDTIPTEALQ